MLAASRDDTTLLWLGTMKQVLAASKAISAAMDAQGHTRHTAHIRAAIDTTEHHFAGQHHTPVPAPAHSAAAAQSPTAARSALHHTTADRDAPEHGR
ncbi:hypothetical protein [Gordonia rhizosphera]|uniref:Uncharacterized protein n=1 Tax=Gordonia rhizosphera NBRC 16068 TaxID=1108045 RepID=K6X3S7_9ACTN|nr:hypothetical protein [Gordonia rhizosphera]GAB93454.1 hypothetical protein GORHZ_222_00090 [Gordonia rhizosphera NBRC 16068]